MKKIISLFKRDYERTRQVYDEVVSGAEWVIAGEGIATVKYDGTCCKVSDGIMYKRHDRKLTKSAAKSKRAWHKGPWCASDFKSAPAGWEAAEDLPNVHTGHWPGWIPVSNGPEDKYHREAFCDLVQDGTYELVGPKVQGNPYHLTEHQLWRHGADIIEAPRTYHEIMEFLYQTPIEGIVWHHPDGRMVKIKRRDFGFDWPINE